MSNTEHLGFNYRGKAWADGKPIPQVQLPDGTVAEAVVSIAYVWNGASFDKVPGDATNGMRVQVAMADTTNSLHANLQISASGTAIAAVTAKKIRVISAFLMASGTVNVKFQSHVAGDITGFLYLIANTGISLPFNPAGWFETTSGEALDISLSAGVPVGGAITYTTI